MLKVGISACFFHADPQRAIFKGMTLQYIEQNMAHWVMQKDAMALMIPSPDGGTRRQDSRVAVTRVDVASVMVRDANRSPAAVCTAARRAAAGLPLAGL